MSLLNDTPVYKSDIVKLQCPKCKCPFSIDLDEGVEIDFQVKDNFIWLTTLKDVYGVLYFHTCISCEFQIGILYPAIDSLPQSGARLERSYIII